MKQYLSKIALFIVIISVFNSCNVVKRVGDNEHLIIKNTIKIDGKASNSETLNNLIIQKTNRKLLNFPLRLHIYNLARPNIDSILDIKQKKADTSWVKFLSEKQFQKTIENRSNFNNWLKKTGEAPTILDTLLTQKTIKRLDDYYFNYGWFNAKIDYNIDYLAHKRAKVTYNITPNTPYVIDTINTKIYTPIVKTIYDANTDKSLVKVGQQYSSNNFLKEKSRVVNLMRNSGIYYFSEDNVKFEFDTIGLKNKVIADYIITNRSQKIGDSTYTQNFKQYKIKDVNIFTDDSFENADLAITDSLTYKGYNFYSKGEMRYRPKALLDAIFINKGDLYSDLDRYRTTRRLSNLRIFKYPNVSFTENPDTTLTANIKLSPLKKFSLGLTAEVSQSNIQTVGISASPSLSIRNVFKGAEILEISGIASIGASKDRASNEDRFFDINELGANLKLIIPRIFSPFKTDNIIRKYMLPTTNISLATSSQTNIGLDKQTFTGVFNYNWKPSSRTINDLDIFNIQYVRNLKIENYFSEYTSSYNDLNTIARNTNYIDDSASLSIPDEAEQFITDVFNGNVSTTNNQFQTVSNINERKLRLTQDNLIIASGFNYTLDKRENAFDNNYSIFRARTEFAGNAVSLLSNVFNLKKSANNQYEILNVPFSQYIKAEIDYIKHWDFSKNNIIAIRSYAGLAVPYGNSNNIPFIKSFFAGGPNDNRAWSAYKLGPGRSGSVNEFNEANLKIALNFEYRYNLFGQLNGALFVDAGNIWNALDDENDPNRKFNGFKSLGDLAIGSGIGFRYDFGLVVLRFDIGFKTYNPSIYNSTKWFRDYNFANAVYNIGINYPF